MFHCLLSEKNEYLNIWRKNESSLLYKVYKLELEMLDNNQPVGILSWAGEVKKMLCELGFAYLWNSQNITSLNTFRFHLIISI